MRYALNLEVKLVELPDLPEPTTIRVGDDPLAAMAKAATGLLNAPVMTAPAFYGASAGLDFRKSVQLSVPDFIEATKVIRRFHALLEEIECQHIPTESQLPT